MTSVPPISTDVSDLRKELILAQIRLMELEDKREALEVKIASSESQFDVLQKLADAKIAERDHCQQFTLSLEHQLRATTQTLEELRQTYLQKIEILQALQRSFIQEKDISAKQLNRINTLDTELTTMKRTLSWRYTAPFRAAYRLLRRSKR